MRNKSIPAPFIGVRQLDFVSRHPITKIMALWRAVVKIDNRLLSTEFESLSNFGSDAKIEAMGRFGTQDITLYPKSEGRRGRV